MNRLYRSKKVAAQAGLVISLITTFMATFVLPLRAQTFSDTLQLPAIRVEASRISEPLKYQPTHVTVIDSVQMELMGTSTMGELLAQETSMFVKTYGPGALSTVSQRGLGATQTQVLWEGVPLNSPSLGLVDFSLIPSNLFSSVEVNPGNTSSSFGGRSIAGTIYMNSDGDSEKLSIHQEAGSYGQFRTGLTAGKRIGAWHLGVKALRYESDNDFTYTDPIAQSVERRSNNGMLNRQIIATIRRDGDYVDASSKLWISDADHQIPGSIVSGKGSAEQFDNAVRWLNTARTSVKRWNLEWNGFYEHYKLNYKDPVSDINSTTSTRKIMTSVDLSRYWNPDFKMIGAVSAGLVNVFTNNYNSEPSRKFFSVQGNPAYQAIESFRIYPAIRYDYYSDFGSAVSPSLGFNWEVKDHYYLRGQAGMDFSPPTFNDLYWVPGGNPQLKPERSRKAELGLRRNRPRSLLGLHDLAIYYIKVFNGIQWNRNEQGTWTPRNLKRIDSWGAAWQFEKAFSWDPLRFRFKQLVQWTKSEMVTPRFSGDAAVGKQLAYTPEWSYKSSLITKASDLTMGLYYRWTGKRFTTADHQGVLDPYMILDMSVQYQLSWEPLNLQLKAKVNNITDTEYQVIQWYPMAGRNYSFSVQVNYNY